MSKLIEAEKRLERAIAELEQATSLSGVANHTDAPNHAEETERNLLRTEELRAVHEAVSKKLDTTILRLKEILEG